MATRTGPDLTPAVVAVEKLMDDTCVITRNPNGLTDATLDQDTGRLADPASSQTVYSGKCALRMSAAGVAQVISIPLSAAELLRGDRVVVTSSRRDKVAVNQEYWVKEPLYGTMVVSRKATLGAPDEAVPE